MAANAKQTNWFAVWVSVVVVAVLVVVTVLVVWMNNAATDPGEPPQGSGIDQETGAVVVGDGEQSMDTYIDFMCPICGQFEEAYGDAILELVDDGTITLNIHPMYCVAEADPDAAVPFMQAMFAGQPTENTEGLTDEEILAMAEGAGVTGIDTCVTEGEYSDYVTAMTQETPIQPGNSGIATPTIEVNGEVIANSELPEPDNLASLFT